MLFKNNVQEDIVAQHKAKLIRKLKLLNALVCETNQQDIELLKQQPEVKDVIPDMLIKTPRPKKTLAKLVSSSQEGASAIPAVSYAGFAPLEWNVLKAGVNSKAAWDNYGVDGTGVKIAFIDSGVNYTLPDIDKNYLAGQDYIDDDGDPLTYDVNEDHGTKVVSTSIGEGESQVVGVAPGASYYVVRVMDASFQGWASDMIAAIQWAMDPDGNGQTDDKADIISMSLGLDENNPSQIVTLLRDACNRAYNQGIVLIASSGNDGIAQSGYPAAFRNVISVGACNQQQLVWEHSNGGVEVVAPGAKVPAIKPDNSAWWNWGTSFSTPHASALMALQLQYARENHMQTNNGYLWEVMKHSTVDLGQDPIYQGWGKIYAARTDIYDSNLGTIDLMAANWPISASFEFSGYAFSDGEYPAYHIGSELNQSVVLTNITDALGNCIENIENLKVTVTQISYDQAAMTTLPGDPVKIFPTIALLEPGNAHSITLNLSYKIPPDIVPGLKQTKLAFEFNFVGNDRVIEVSYLAPSSLWYAAIAADLDLNNSINMCDFATFAQNWRDANCNEPDFCGRADINKSGSVNWYDLSMVAENWLYARWLLP